MVEHPPSTLKNLKYQKHVLLNNELEYYILSLHESNAIDQKILH